MINSKFFLLPRRLFRTHFSYHSIKIERQYIESVYNSIGISILLSLKVARGQLIEYTPKTVSFQQSVQSISERIISEIPVRILNQRENLQVFVSPQTVSLTVVGGMDFIAKLKPEDIFISIDFNMWNSRRQFYDLKVQTPSDVIEWMYLSPQSIELVVTKRAG